MSVSELDTTADKHWLQGIGGDKVGFSHGISTVDAKYITDHARWYSTVVPVRSVLDHEGIDDGFMERLHLSGTGIKVSGLLCKVQIDD